MADEEKNQLTDQETGDKVHPTPEYSEGEAERLPEPETGLEEAVQKGVEASEEAADSPVVEAFDSAVTAVQDAVDTLEPERDEGVSDLRRPMMESTTAATSHGSAAAHDDHAEFLSDTTTVFGRTITVEGGIYTVVFGFLAAATLLEIAVGSLPRSDILISHPAGHCRS